MSHSSSGGARRRTPDPRLPVRAGRLLRVRAVWVAALVVGSLVVAAMAALYIASATDPLAHLSGLPVAVVNQDRGAAVGAQRLDVGQQIEAGLLAAPAVTDRLRLEALTLAEAEQAMDRDGLYATLVIPPGLTDNLLTAAGLHPAAAGGAAGAAAGGGAGAAITAPRVEIIINERAGTVGTSLATGILQPALAVASRQIGRHLAPLVPAGSQAPATRLLLADPVTVTTVQYRPLPNNAGLGLNAFYIALLALMCGFIGATIVNSVVDSALGYATTDLGPRWRQRQPVPINRWQTLLIKWAIIVAATAVLTAVMLLVAWGVGMDMPYPWLLWAFTWLCAVSVGIGTIALLAMAGNYGQLIGLLVFVYAGLASAGGTVPVEALPGFLRTLSYVEPLRQVLAGTRSILYFNAQGVAGLTRGTVAAAAGLVFWLVVGAVVVRWYDRKGFYRLRPEVLAHVNQAVEDFRAKQAAPAPAPPDGTQPPGGETGPGA
jgi:YhgE/Pip-like protein